MVIKHIYSFILGIILLLSNALSPYQNLIAQEVDSTFYSDSELYSQFLYLPESDFVVNPFPDHITNLVQPIDSTSNPKGILNLSLIHI